MFMIASCPVKIVTCIDNMRKKNIILIVTTK